MGTLGVKTEMDLLVECLNEDFLENVNVVNYVHKEVATYCKGLGFDPLDNMTEIQQEVVCQYQLTVYHHILASMIKAL